MLWQDGQESGAGSTPAEGPGAEAADGTTPGELDGLVESAAQHWDLWLLTLGRVGVAVLVGLAIHWVLFWILRRGAGRTSTEVDDIVVRRLRGPARLALPLLGVQFVLPSLAMIGEGELAGLSELLRHANSIGLIAAVAWLASSGVKALEEIVLTRHDIRAQDNLHARRTHTQLHVLRRVVVFFIIVVGVAAVLMTFPRIRQLGTSLLASAGLAGLVVGLAARPMLENLIAGVQIALTQPIRLDDVVIIEGEWGRIEEITTTYVVVRIWDQRRLIVPFSRVLASPFQNWTRQSAEILGTVYLRTDYTVPVSEVREALKRYVEDHPKWDRRTVGLQVTDTSERTMELRALVSAEDASKAWDLRCDVREHLIDYLQREHPGSLPVEREVHIEGRAGDGRAPDRRPSEEGDSAEGGDPGEAGESTES